MVVTPPQPSFLWRPYQVSSRQGQSRALHPEKTAGKTRYSSEQSLQSWEPDHSFPFHSQMRINIRKDKMSSRMAYIYCVFYTFECYIFYVLYFSKTPRGFASNYHILQSWCLGQLVHSI